MLMVRPKDSYVDEVTVRKVFNTTIDVRDYLKTFDQAACEAIQVGAVFVRFAWLDISDYTFDDERLENIGIRADQNPIEDAEDMSYSLSYKGWNAGYFPVIVSTNGRVKDGRTRILAAILAGEQYVPCAVFEYEDDDSILMQISNGLVANIGDPRRIAKGNDFVVAGIRIIEAGQLKCTEKDILDWLINTVRIEQVMSNVGGNITKIVKRIMTRVENSSTNKLLVIRSRDSWLEYMNESIDRNAAYYRNKFGIQSIDDVVLYVSNGNKDAMTFCEHILPKAAEGKVTNVVLYSPIDDPDATVKNHKAFLESIEKFHEYMYQWINRELSNVTLTKPEVCTLWRVIGVMPQFVGIDKHRKLYTNKMLASMSDLPKAKDELGNTLFDD